MKKAWFLVSIIFISIGNASYAQMLDERIKTLALELADQIIANGGTKVAVTMIDYKNCESTEFGKFLAEELTGYLSTSGRKVAVINQKFLKTLLEQNKLTKTGIIETQNEAAKLGKVSGIDALVYGTVTSLGEDLKLSLSVVRLPTLEVYGFAKCSLSLTNGIKTMLECQNVDTNNSTNTNSPKLETTTNFSFPKPKPDCKYKPSCVLCVTNNSKEPVEVQPQLSNQLYVMAGEKLYLHPTKTKCWEEMGFSVSGDHDTARIDVSIMGSLIKSYKEIIEPCRVYNVIHK